MVTLRKNVREKNVGREGKGRRKSTEIEEGKRTRERLKEGLEGERESEGKRKKRGGRGRGRRGIEESKYNVSSLTCMFNKK